MWRIRMNSQIAGILALSSMALGCRSISYSPELSLGVSPTVIHATVLLEDFRDETPPRDHMQRFLQLVPTEPGSLSGSLATHVTNEILSDFQRNHVFKTISKLQDEPDLLLSGAIRRFHAVSGILLYTLPIDVLWYLGLPCCRDEGHVELHMVLRRPDGTLVAEYEGSSEFGGVFTAQRSGVRGCPCLSTVVD